MYERAALLPYLCACEGRHMYSDQNREVEFRDLGRMDYKACWDLQESMFASVVQLKSTNRNRPEEERVPTPNHLLFVEHPHVYTLGKSGNDDNLLVKEDELKERDATFYRINRGGDITYHGPGQLVVYPIFDLDNFFTDIHRYLRTLEDAVIEMLAGHGINAGRSKGETGVWIEPEATGRARKICAMGVRCSRWVTMHGLALNVDPDLSYFGNIVPCGITDKAVTSMRSETSRPVNMDDVKESLKRTLAEKFGFHYAAATTTAESR
jgi:lipoyl(octanoyl) transferase